MFAKGLLSLHSMQCVSTDLSRPQLTKFYICFIKAVYVYGQNVRTVFIKVIKMKNIYL